MHGVDATWLRVGGMALTSQFSARAAYVPWQFSITVRAQLLVGVCERFWLWHGPVRRPRLDFADRIPSRHVVPGVRNTATCRTTAPREGIVRNAGKLLTIHSLGTAPREDTRTVSKYSVIR